MRHVFLLALLVGASSATAREYRVDLQPEGAQQSGFMQGAEAIVDVQAGSNVLVLEAVDPDKKRGQLVVGVLNNGAVPFNFGPENVTVHVGEQTIAMLTSEELVREQKRREGRQRFAMALSGAMSGMAASQAGNTYGTATYSGNTYGSVSGQPFAARTYGTATYAGYDAAAAQAAQARANEETARNTAVMESNLAAKRARIDQTLKVNTIMPGQRFVGPVMFDVPEAISRSKAPVPVTIVLQAGDEAHTFKALIGPAKAFVRK